MMLLGLPATGSWTVFLDIDGTLVDVALTPEAVSVPPELPELLTELQRALGGALAPSLEAYRGWRARPEWPEVSTIFLQGTPMTQALGPQAFAKFRKDDLARWADIIQKANIVLE